MLPLPPPINSGTPVATVVSLVAGSMTQQEILTAYPDLELADLQGAWRLAAQAGGERELPLGCGMVIFPQTRSRRRSLPISAD